MLDSHARRGRRRPPAGSGGGDGGYLPPNGCDYTTDVPDGSTYHDAIYWMSDQTHLRGICTGAAFHPNDDLTRGRMCEFVTLGYRLTMPTQNLATPW